MAFHPTRPFANYLQALLSLVRVRKRLLLCAVPYVVGLLAWVAALTFLISAHSTILTAVLSLLGIEALADTWWAKTLAMMGFGFGYFLSAGIFALLIIPLVSGTLQERVLLDVLSTDYQQVTSRRSEPVSFLHSFFHALCIDGIRVICLGVLFVASILSLLFPPLLIFCAVFAAFFAGWDLLEVPLEVIGLTYKERVSYVLRHVLGVMVLGGIFLLLATIPFGAVLFHPVGQIAGLHYFAHDET